MNQTLSIAGRVCLCEWSGPVTVTMVVSLLSQLKQIEQLQGAPCVLLLQLKPAAAASINKSASTFQDVLPALGAYCQEVLLVCHGDAATLDQLRRTLHVNERTLPAPAPRQLSVFGLLDDAFKRTEQAFPHDVLELRRQRIRSGTWLREGDGHQTTEPGRVERFRK